MKDWLLQVANDAGRLISSYPALIVLAIVLLIVIALVWVWFKVPAGEASSPDESLWKRLLSKLKNGFKDIWNTVATVAHQLFSRAHGQYDVPLYLVLNPTLEASLVGSLPPSKTKRLPPSHIRDLLASDSQDKCLSLKQLTLLDVSISSLGNLKSVIERITRKRPQRPIDGLLVSIPVSEVMGKNEEQLDELSERLSNSMLVVDKQVPFHLPIYVVVSGCDVLPSYQAFARQNKDQHDEIFGWSSDEDFGSRYRAQFVQRAFFSVAKSIHRNQVVRSSQLNGLFDADDYVLVDHDLSLLKSRVEMVCNTLFKQDSYQNGFEFRGLYFVGQSTQDSASSQSSDTLFLNDLLENKIASEANFAVPTGHGLRLHEKLLTRYKRVSVAALMFLVLLGVWNLWSLKAQLNNVAVTMNTIKSPKLDSGTGYSEVYKVLEQLSDVDARSFSRLGLPISWFSSTDEQLVKRISDQQLAGVVFPAMQCRVSQRFKSLLLYEPSAVFDRSSGVFQWAYAGAWLNRLDEFQQTRGTFISLSEPTRNSSGTILDDFSNLILALYGIKPAAGFFRRNELYQEAFERLDYNYNRVNKRCPNGSSGVDNASSSLFWSLVEKEATAFYKQIQSSSMLPDLSADSAESDELSGNDYVKLENWFSYLDKMWVGDDVGVNPCQQMYQRLTAVDAGWSYEQSGAAASIADKTIALFDKHNCESVFYQQLKTNKLAALTPLFVAVQGDEEKLRFSSAVVALRGSFGSVQNLAFMALDTSQLPPKTPDKVIWDTQRLLKALSYYREYERYAIANFEGLKLPSETSSNAKAYVLQSGILAQLRLAMNYELAWAQTDVAVVASKSANSVASLEQDLLGQVKNFNSTMDLFYQLREALSQLGFQAESQAWQATTAKAALSLLQSSDQLVSASRLYLPQVPTNDSEPTVIGALYGISDAKSLKNYLLSQSQRASFIAQNYANNPVAYLLNLDSGQTANQSITQESWQQTLAQLSRYALKDPTNSLTTLEKMFADSMTLTLDNCPTNVTIGPGEDIFTNSQTTLMESIVAFCSQSKESQSSKNYDWVVSEFNANLKGKFPFVDVSKATAVDASFAAVDNFFTEFDTFSAALYKELSLKAQADTRHVAARDFIGQLITVSEFLGDNLSTGNATSTASLTIKPMFKVLVKPSIGEEQIISQSLQSNGNEVAIPGSTDQLVWNFGADMSFTARLANTSTYQLASTSTYQLAMPSSVVNLVGDYTVTFPESGNWALLRLLQGYRSNIAANTLVPKSGSIKLLFPVNTKKTQTSTSSATETKLVPSVINLIVGVDVYGTNSKTKQLELKTVPDIFPSTAPTF